MSLEDKLVNIKEGFSLYNNNKKCITAKNCSCSADLKMPKWRNDGNSMFKVG